MSELREKLTAEERDVLFSEVCDACAEHARDAIISAVERIISGRAPRSLDGETTPLLVAMLAQALFEPLKKLCLQDFTEAQLGEVAEAVIHRLNLRHRGASGGGPDAQAPISVGSIRETMKGITQWPWAVGRWAQGDGPWCPMVSSRYGYGAPVCHFSRYGIPERDRIDAAFIAMAPEAIDFLLARVEELERERGFAAREATPETLPSNSRTELMKKWPPIHKAGGAPSKGEK